MTTYITHKIVENTKLKYNKRKGNYPYIHTFFPRNLKKKLMGTYLPVPTLGTASPKKLYDFFNKVPIYIQYTI